MSIPNPVTLSREWQYARRQLQTYFDDLYSCCVETGVGLAVLESAYLGDYWGGTKPDSCQYLAVVLTDSTVKMSFDGGTTWTVVYDTDPMDTFESGIVMPYAGGDTSPSGWLLCDGSAVSRATYADLFTAIGTTFGAGNGTTTFNLPDLRGRILTGVNDGTTPNGANGTFTSRARAATFGAETHTLITNEMASHTHTTVSGGTANLPATGGQTATRYGSAAADPTGSAGSDTAHNNMMPAQTTNYIIKT